MASSDRSDDEVQLVHAFFREGRRERALHLLSTPRGRRKLLLGLAHTRDLAPSVLRPIESSAQTPEAINKLLVALGAPSHCYLVSEAAELDQCELPLREALLRVVGCGFGTIVSCLTGRLAYYESEEPGERFVLLRD
jgi:hypothetical protein